MVITLFSVPVSDVCVFACMFQNQELVVMVGVPASGKSTFSKQYFQPNGYVSVNRDTLGTVEKCLKVRKKIVLSDFMQRLFTSVK